MTNTQTNKKWFMTPGERAVFKMEGPLVKVGPKHPLWPKRVKAEVLNLKRYLDYIIQSGGRPWFQLYPSTKKEHNYLIWYGHLNVATRPEIKFDIVVLLPATYPIDCPRALIHDEVLHEYKCSNIYVENKYSDPTTKKTYVMICHDHMKEVGEAWLPELTISHFFIREIHTWWEAKQNDIIEEWDKKH